MSAISEFSVFYSRKKGVSPRSSPSPDTGVMRVMWGENDPCIFVCSDTPVEIGRAILANLTQQWDASVMTRLGLSNLGEKNIEDVAEALGARLPAADEFTLTQNDLVEILKAL